MRAGKAKTIEEHSKNFFLYRTQGLKKQLHIINPNVKKVLSFEQVLSGLFI